MSLLNYTFLRWLGLAAIPVLLHLLMRAKPKRLIFPALRLIQQRRRQNVRRMQLRHLWLLILRVAVIALIVLAICRPSLPAANYSLNGLEWSLLLLIIAAAVGGYFGLMHWWQRQGMTRTALLTRRTMLRGGIGSAAILLALIGVVWPYARRVSAEIKNPAPLVAENVPVAAVYLFDTSASMSYKQANKTRLRAAQEIAKTHLGRFPGGSKVAAAATGDPTPVAFSSDLVAAQSRIDSLEIKSASQSLNDRLMALLQVQEDDRRRVTSEQASVPADQRQDRFVREIYLFTDLAKSAWRDEVTTQLRDELQRLPWIGVYIIDVGETEPVNIALTSLRLSREAVPARGIVRVEAAVSSTGQVKPEQTVELYLRTPEGTPVRKATESVKLEAGSETRVAFPQVEIPPQPYTQGELRLVGSDPLNVDDVLHFSVHTIPTLKVLVVAERPAISQYWMLALKILADSGVSAFQVENATTDQLADRDLREFDVVCLINSSKPSDAVWTRLQAFVEGGGGLAVFLGASSSLLSETPSVERINPLSYQTEAAMKVLPARLGASLSHTPARAMDLRRSQHPLLKRFDELGGALTELSATPVRRYWKVEPTESAAVVARYAAVVEGDADGAPALIERRIGQGRVLMMTTGVDGISWNDLPSPDNWLYVVFVDQVTQYLAWQSTGVFNHLVGDEVSIPLDRERKLTQAILRMPDFKQRVIEVPPKSSFLTLRDLASVGSYSIDSAEKGIEFHAGFSVNLPASESDLRRMEAGDLDTLLGEKRYSVNRDPESLERRVAEGRLGQEMYSMVVAFLVAVFALEQFTATWFYRTDETT
jgi:hypothetical protein